MTNTIPSLDKLLGVEIPLMLDSGVFSSNNPRTVKDNAFRYIRSNDYGDDSTPYNVIQERDYEDGLKFLLFSDSEGSLYLRVKRNILSEEAANEHFIIHDKFKDESREAIGGSHSVHGGGYVRLVLGGDILCLEFHERSTEYGKFDKVKLRELLDKTLDKRLRYELR